VRCIKSAVPRLTLSEIDFVISQLTTTTTTEENDDRDRDRDNSRVEFCLFFQRLLGERDGLEFYRQQWHLLQTQSYRVKQGGAVLIGFMKGRNLLSKARAFHTWAKHVSAVQPQHHNLHDEYYLQNGGGNKSNHALIENPRRGSNIGNGFGAINTTADGMINDRQVHSDVIHADASKAERDEHDVLQQQQQQQQDGFGGVNVNVNPRRVCNIGENNNFQVTRNKRQVMNQGLLVPSERKVDNADDVERAMEREALHAEVHTLHQQLAESKADLWRYKRKLISHFDIASPQAPPGSSSPHTRHNNQPAVLYTSEGLGHLREATPPPRGTTPQQDLAPSSRRGHPHNDLRSDADTPGGSTDSRVHMKEGVSSVRKNDVHVKTKADTRQNNNIDSDMPMISSKALANTPRSKARSLFWRGK
jgi:hypothetical protein